jgi:hypothetical protein
MKKNFNYEDYYENRSDAYSKFVQDTGKRKASYIKKFLGNTNEHSVLAEVGTGPGDVLNAFDEFQIKIGLDISYNSLQKQVDNYFNKKIIIKDFTIDFLSFYEKRISRKEIIEGFKDRPVFSDGNLFLIKTEPNSPLPFEDKSIDYLILCDIVEHVDHPLEFLKDAARISEFLLLKFPVEKAVLILLMSKLRGIKYGVNHPSGHLWYWSKNEIFSLLRDSNIEILGYEFEPSKYEYSDDKFFIKKLVFYLIGFLDLHFSKTWLFSRLFLGGNLYLNAKSN